MTELLYPALVVFTGYVVFGITGFGSALIIVPLLAWRLPLDLIVPLVLMLDLAASVQLGHLNFREIRFDEVRRMVPGLLLGTLIGLQLTALGNSSALLVALGAYVAWAGVNGLRQRTATSPLAADWATPFALASGVVEALFGTSGPLIVTYLTRRLSDPLPLRITIASAILVVVAITLAGFAVTGRLSNPRLWELLPWLLVTTLLGCYLGNRLVRRLSQGSPQLLRRFIQTLLIASGLSLAANAML